MSVCKGMVVVKQEMQTTKEEVTSIHLCLEMHLLVCSSVYQKALCRKPDLHWRDSMP